ncbi:alpha/beta hydrolase [Mucilaginibacter sp. SP1R1]|uniref:alpha/beta hydrolase n=1 Tax=Mucilaginibacter sp. SP1R1 TaxID=2723091 RepID=UPI0016164F66|nr:alpha/beta hydrolase [Mucilaginibacter sp. SP1R1]MBB6150358.1 acetyl esterase/lipase [Mucilaginibacter sp. SP1R1]
MIRLVLLLIFFLASLLTIFKAPAYYLWLLAIAVTEYPLIFVGLTTLVTLSGVWVSSYKTPGNIVGIITILLFISPVIRAYIVAKNVKHDMQQAFNGMHTDSSTAIFPKDGTPFDFFNLFKKTTAVPYKSLTYVKYQDTSLSLDFYSSRILGRKPCVIMIHGGSWSSGDSQQLPELNSYLAQKGYHVASINYRMAPKYQTPAPVEDVSKALNYLCKHAAELHIDTNKFILLGRSAGAQIALLAAYTLHDVHVKGVIDFYGPADMIWGYSIPSNPLIMDSRGVMDRYIGGTYPQVPEKYAACSPLEFVDKQSIPTLIIHGANDVLVAYEHSRRLNEKLQQNGIRRYWLKLPWATHGFDYNINGPGGQLSTYAVETFLNTITQ